MPELTEEQKTALAEKEAKEKADKEKENEEEDPFSEVFKDDEEEEGKEKKETIIDEDEEEEEKPPKKPAKKEKPVQQLNQNLEKIEAVERRIERRQDVSDYLLSDRGKMFEKFAPQIRKAATDPRFANIPITQLAAVILTPTAYTNVLTEAKKVADDEAADSVLGGRGGANRGAVNEELSKIDPTTMSKEEFAKMRADAKRGKFLIKKK